MTKNIRERIGEVLKNLSDFVELLELYPDQFKSKDEGMYESTMEEILFYKSMSGE